jgi:hypothetical protein
VVEGRLMVLGEVLLLLEQELLLLLLTATFAAAHCCCFGRGDGSNCWVGTGWTDSVKLIEAVLRRRVDCLRCSYPKFEIKTKG